MRVTSRRGTLVAPARIDPALRAGIVFMTLHFPDEVATNVADHRRRRSQVGHRRVQGLRRARGTRRRRSRAARARTAWTSACIDARPTDEERAAVEAVLGPPGVRLGRRARAPRAARCTPPTGGRAQRERRHLLLPALQALQARVGWVSDGGMRLRVRALGIPPAEAWSVATFYALLATSPRPAARRARVRRHPLPRARRGGALRGSSTHECGPALAAAATTGPRAAARRPAGCARRAWACATTAPAALLTRGGRAAARAAARRPSPPSRCRRLLAGGTVGRRTPRARFALPQRGEAGARAPAPRRRRGPVEPRGLPRRRRLRRRSPRALAMGPEAVIAEVDGREARRAAAAPPSPRRASGRPCARRPATPALPGLQRRRVRARHLQGPRAPDRRPVRHRRVA